MKNKGNILFTRKDIVAFLAHFVVSQSQCIYKNMAEILNDADEWLLKNEIAEPNVSIPDFVLYEASEGDLFQYLNKMVESVPSIFVLNERSEENKNDFIDLGALARNICNSIRRDFEITQSIGVNA